jgi:hypothetical protein
VAVDVATHERTSEARRLDEGGDVDTRHHTERVEQVHEIFEGHVARGAGRERTAAEAADAAVEAGGARFERGERVAEGQPTRVVEMGTDRDAARPGDDGGDEVGDLGGNRRADRVGQRDAVDAVGQ